MKWTYWLLFGLALVLVTSGVAMVKRQSHTTPEDFFAAVESRIDSGQYDREQVIQNLDQVLERAQASGDSDLTARVLLRRGRTLRNLGAYEQAKADLLAAAAMRPTDTTVEDDLVDLEARAGDFNAALQRARRMIELDPAKPHGHVILGRLHRQAAEKAIERGRALLEQALPAREAAQAVALLSRSGALEPADVQRIAIANRLRGILRTADEARIEEVLDVADSAARDGKAAREAFSASLVRGAEIEAVTGLARLLQRAGRTDIAVDLASLTVRMPEMRGNPQFSRTLMRALAELDRWSYASEIAIGWIVRPTTVAPDFLEECCAVLWQGGRPEYLLDAGHKLWGVGTEDQREIAQLYIGLWHVKNAMVLDAQAAAQTDAAARADSQAQARGNWQTARSRLQLFTATKQPDPFPRARAIAWRSIAQASRELGELVAERTGINGYLAIEPAADGEMWLRLAEVELTAPNASYRDPDLHFALGMSLLPRRTKELMKRWNEIGVQEMRAMGIDLESIETDLGQGRVFMPNADAPTYLRYKLSEMHAKVGDWPIADMHLRYIQNMVPGFVPGLDIAIRIQDGQDRTRERMETLLERVRAAGRTEEIDAILSEVPLEELEPREKLALMRADPERSGRILLATGLFRRGRVAEALETLGAGVASAAGWSAAGSGSPAPGAAASGAASSGASPAGDEGGFLAARLHLAQREPERALEDLVALGQNLFTMPGGIEVYASAAIGASDRARLDSLGTLLARRLLRPAEEANDGAPPPFPLDRTRALAIADQMLAAGQGPSVHPILKALDAAPKTRGGDVALRLVASAVLRREMADARIALDRAQAYETRGAADQVELLLAALQAAAAKGTSARFPDLAERVEKSGYAMGPLLRVQNALLQGELPAARALLEARIAGPLEHDPWWNLTAFAAASLASDPAPRAMPAWMGANGAAQARLLIAGPDGTRDPRIALALLSGVDDALGAPYARAWLATSTNETAGDLWPAYIAATLDAQQGSGKKALETLQRVHQAYPDFGPAWDLEEKILAQGELTEKVRADFTRRRDAHMSGAMTSGPQQLLDTALAQRDAGALDGALQAARSAIEADPWLVEARTLEAELLSLSGNPRAALATLQAGLEQKPPTNGRPWPIPPTSPADMAYVRAFLDVVAKLRDTPVAEVPRTRLESLLKALSLERPDDPRIVLALAELDVGADAHNQSMGVLRAYGRLDAFRANHKGVPLERLMEGSVRDWSRFFMRLDAERAEVFLASELMLDPTVLATWMELAHAAEADGRMEEALVRMGLVARLAPRGDVLRELLRLRAMGEIPPEEIEARVRAIVEAEHAQGPDAELVLSQARCYLNLGPRFHDKVLELVQGLEALRDLSPDFRRRHAMLWATVLMSRGAPEEVVVAKGLLDELRARGGGSAYERGFVDALWGLAQAPVQ